MITGKLVSLNNRGISKFQKQKNNFYLVQKTKSRYYLSTDAPFKQRISVSRVDGVMELRKEIKGVYKKPDTNFKVNSKIRFEEEEGVGSGRQIYLFIYLLFTITYNHTRLQ